MITLHPSFEGLDGEPSTLRTDAAPGRREFVKDNQVEPSFSAIQQDIEQRRERIARKLEI